MQNRLRAGPLVAEGAGQVVEDQPVEDGELGRGVAGDAGRHPPGLEHHHAPALLLEQHGRGQAGDAGADHDDVGLHVAVQLMEPGRLGRAHPQRRIRFVQSSHG